MKSSIRGLLFAALAFGWLPGAQAQDWNWAFAPYLWAAGVDGTVSAGTPDVEVGVDLSDFLDVTEGGLVLGFESTGQNHGAFGEIAFLSLDFDGSSGVPPVRTEAELDLTILELGYLLRPSEMGLEAGVRYWDADITVASGPSLPVERGRDWLDLFVGFRWSGPVGDDWEWGSRVNIGSGDSDFTAGVGVDFSRRFDSDNRLIVGLKLLDVDFDRRDVGGVPVTLNTTLIGAIVGFSFE